MTDDCKTFFIEALLLWIHHYRMHEGKREEFKHAIIIEEAHHILLKKKQQAEGGEAITDVVLREIRELGESIILIDQHPSLISVPALGNTNITIGMNLKHGADVSALVNAMLLTKDQYHYLGMIEVGKAIVKIQSRYPNPFLVSFPWAKSQRKISNEDIKERMEGFYRKYSLKKLERQRQKEISVSSHYDLSPQERDFLIDVFTNPFSSMSERYKRLGFNNRLGNQIKDCLIKKGALQSRRYLRQEREDKAPRPHRERSHDSYPDGLLSESPKRAKAASSTSTGRRRSVINTGRRDTRSSRNTRSAKERRLTCSPRKATRGSSSR